MLDCRDTIAPANDGSIAVRAALSSQRIGWRVFGTVHRTTPPGCITRAHSLIIAQGSSTYSSTLDATTASKLEAPNGSLRQLGSSWTQSTDESRSFSAAPLSIRGEMSHAVTGIPMEAMARASSPVPQPRSSTRLAGGT